MFFQKIRSWLAVWGDWRFQRQCHREERREALAKLAGHENGFSSCLCCAAALRDALGSYSYDESYFLGRKRCHCGGTHHFLGFNERWFSLDPGSSTWMCDRCFAKGEASPPRPELADHEIGNPRCIICRRKEPFLTGYGRDQDNETCRRCGGIMHTFGVEVFEWKETNWQLGAWRTTLESITRIVLQCDRCFKMDWSGLPPYSGPPLRKYRDPGRSDPGFGPDVRGED